MKPWKTWKIALFVALCVLLNYGGRLLALRFSLPLWLDTFGTALCAYVGGPVCGCLVGVTGNAIYGMMFHNPFAFVYALTSVAMGIIVGVAAKKDRLSTLFGTMTVASSSALAAVAISVPLNLIFYGGSTGNLWGDGAMAFLQQRGIPFAVSAFAGAFYIEFMDKLLTMLALALVLWLIRRRKPASGAAAALLLPLTVMALGLLALPLCPAARAEGAGYTDYVQTVFSSGNGLPCGEANDIAQTSDGLMWIGTYAGLYRCNGREFRVMDYDSVHNVNCLYVDGEGRLWIGTNDSGLSIAINEQVVNVVDQAHGLPSDSVRSIIESSDGYYYIGTTGSMQILTLNSGLKRFATLREVNQAEELAADGRGHVAAVTKDGRLFLLSRGRILSSLRLTSGTELFTTCAFNQKGYLLAGTSAGTLYRYDISSGDFELSATRTLSGLGSLNNLYHLENGETFVVSDNGVGYIDDRGSYHGVNTNDFNNSIDNMLVDYQGNLWFTSSRLGLLRLAPSAFKDVYTANGMATRVVNAVVRWGEGYCFGTDKGLDVVDQDCHTELYSALTQSLEGVRIRCLLVDDAGSLWICTYSAGVIEVEADGTQHVYADETTGCGLRTRVATQLGDGTVAVGGNTGISFIRDHQVVGALGKADGLDNPIILSLSELADGRLLVGTDGGGIAFVENGAVTGRLSVDDGLSSRVILRTVNDPKSGGVFIVTSNGLCYMDANGAVRALKNFPYFNNYNIWIRDEDTLFVMGSAGIYVADRQDVIDDTPNMTWELLDARRGLNSAITANSFFCYDGDHGLFLPCDRGVFVLDVEGYASGADRYRMMTSMVRLDDEEYRVERSGPIAVDRDVSTIILYPEIINFTIQDPNVGFYLEGFDKDWRIQSSSGLNQVVYTNLPPGDYVFHMAVFDNSLTRIVEERAYTLTKAREIYDYTWFSIYIVLVPLIAVAWFTWFVVNMRMRRAMERQERELAMARHQVEMGNQTIIAIAKAVDAKDERTSQHSQRVSVYSVQIGKQLGFSDEECENLRRAALMHDIGKIGIPDRILNKNAKLTDEEYAVMKSHTLRGAQILQDFTLIDHIVEGAQYHHERYDGKGYPSGLKGEDIPIYGRIIGVADAFDAMTANRVYRKQMDFNYVLGEMERGRGTQFDPKIVDILLKLIDDGTIDLNKLYGVTPEGGETT